MTNAVNKLKALVDRAYEVERFYGTRKIPQPFPLHNGASVILNDSNRVTVSVNYNDSGDVDKVYVSIYTVSIPGHISLTDAEAIAHALDRATKMVRLAEQFNVVIS